MADDSRKQSFWTTLPGILTGIAAILTAAGGIIVGLHQGGVLSSADKHNDSSVAVAEPTPAAGSLSGSVSDSSSMPVNGSAPNFTPTSNNAASVAEIIVTQTDGTNTTLSKDSFYFGNSGAVDLTNGQSIEFKNIKAIDLFNVEDEGKIKLRITTKGGEILVGEAAARADSDVGGENKLGSFQTPMKNVKRVTFQR